MEHSTKMTLVPTTEAELTQLSELDSELTNILKVLCYPHKRS